MKMFADLQKDYDETIDALMEEYDKLMKRNALLRQALREAAKYARNNQPMWLSDEVIESNYLSALADRPQDRDPNGEDFIHIWLNLAEKKLS